MILSTSKALQITHENSETVVSNILTGRCLSVAPHIEKLLYFCKTAREEEEIIAFLSDVNVPSKYISATIVSLLKKNILVAEENDMFVDTIPAHPTLWGSVPLVKSGTKIIILGAPFGFGNTEDTRCKDFPMYFRKYIWGYYSCKKLAHNIDQLNPMEFGPGFNFSNFKEVIRRCSIADIGDVMFFSGETSDMFYSRLKNISKNIFQNSLIPICIGGDHSITFPIIAALNEVENPFIVLHFDAHADMKNGAVMKLHECLGEKIVNHANVINRILEFHNVVHIYQIGVREPFLYNDKKITRINICDINKTKFLSDLISTSMPVYITFDVDYFDVSLSSGTASILPNGGDYDSTFKFLAEILKHKCVLGMDIVEANPSLDIRNTTTLLVNNLLMQIISQIKV